MIIRTALIALSAIILTSTNALAISLKNHSVVNDDVIRITDIFHGVENHSAANRVLGAAPQPGQSMYLNARTLQRVATAMDLPWRPGSLSDHVKLQRAATVIKASALSNQVKHQLTDKAGSDDFEVIFTSAQAQIILPPHMEPTFEIETLEYNPENYWFEAQIVAPNKHNIHARQKIYGKIKPTIDVPVLKNTIRNGDVISRHDITTIKAPLHSINHDVYLKAQDLIGLTPRRLITAGSPIKEADVQEPRMVDRGDSVTIVYNSGPLRLTSTGRALQHGAKGDLVRVTNAQSKQTIDAVVSGDQEVTVETF